MSHSCRTTISTYIRISEITAVSSGLAAKHEPTAEVKLLAGQESSQCLGQVILKSSSFAFWHETYVCVAHKEGKGDIWGPVFREVQRRQQSVLPLNTHTPPYLRPPHWAPPSSPAWKAHLAAGRGCGALCRCKFPCHWRWHCECKWLLSECPCPASPATPGGRWNLHAGWQHWGVHSEISERCGQ